MPSFATDLLIEKEEPRDRDGEPRVFDERKVKEVHMASGPSGP